MFSDVNCDKIKQKIAKSNWQLIDEIRLRRLDTAHTYRALVTNPYSIFQTLRLKLLNY